MKNGVFTLLSIALFLYLLTVGGHFVAARWWLVFLTEMPSYLEWWNQSLSSALRVTLWFLFPALVYSWLQLYWLQRSTVHERI